LGAQTKYFYPENGNAPFLIPPLVCRDFPEKFRVNSSRFAKPQSFFQEKVVLQENFYEEVYNDGCRRVNAMKYAVTC
jgi:hypothetical protein